MSKYPRTFDSYEQLEEFLRKWNGWGGPDEGDYDFAGLMNLFLACLDNFIENEPWTWPEECEFTEAERKYLKKMLGESN